MIHKNIQVLQDSTRIILRGCAPTNFTPIGCCTYRTTANEYTLPHYHFMLYTVCQPNNYSLKLSGL